MLGNRSRPRISLPKQWPDHVRSGVLHAISLTRFSLTFTRSWAANSVNARIRLTQENDRLRQELALLREEMRIKDSRMRASRHSADRTTRPPSGWQSLNCAPHVGGRPHKSPNICSSRPRRSTRGWAGSTRKVRAPSSGPISRSTSSPSSWPTSFGDSRCCAPRWARPRSPRCSAGPDCTSGRRRFSGCWRTGPDEGPFRYRARSHEA